MRGRLTCASLSSRGQRHGSSLGLSIHSPAHAHLPEMVTVSCSPFHSSAETASSAHPCCGRRDFDRSQIVDIHEPLLHGVCHALIPAELEGLPDESILSGLAELLYEADEALVARALFDLDTRAATSVPLFYALLPASSGGSSWLLARRYRPPVLRHAMQQAWQGPCTGSIRHPTAPDSLNTRSAFPVPIHFAVPLTTSRASFLGS